MILRPSINKSKETQNERQIQELGEKEFYNKQQGGLTMQCTKEFDVNTSKWWGGARDTIQDIREADKMDALQEYIEEVFYDNTPDEWTFIVELDALPSERPLASFGIVPVRLSNDFDRGDIEPYVDVANGGILHCTIGKHDNDGDEVREIGRVWKYENEPVNNKFCLFTPVSLLDFVRCFCDAMKYDGATEDEIQELKKHYGVL